MIQMLCYAFSVSFRPAFMARQSDFFDASDGVDIQAIVSIRVVRLRTVFDRSWLCLEIPLKLRVFSDQFLGCDPVRDAEAFAPLPTAGDHGSTVETVVMLDLNVRGAENLDPRNDSSLVIFLIFIRAPTLGHSKFIEDLPDDFSRV